MVLAVKQFLHPNLKACSLHNLQLEIYEISIDNSSMKVLCGLIQMGLTQNSQSFCSGLFYLSLQERDIMVIPEFAVCEMINYIL